ncbi:MAG: Txe/YoeB family addiction module toxin [Chthoniobacterales bacterium]
MSARAAGYTSRFREDLSYWQETKPKLAGKILKLVQETIREPFAGIGKPEPLRHELSGCWSRRIDREHRLVYRVDKEKITFLQCRYHY